MLGLICNNHCLLRIFADCQLLVVSCQLSVVSRKYQNIFLLPPAFCLLPPNLMTLDSRGLGYGAWVGGVFAKPWIQFV
jgi:hypothetical protein